MKFCLVHALSRTNDRTKVKFDFYFAQEIDSISSRMKGVVGPSHITMSEWESVSSTATSHRFLNVILDLVDGQFTPLSTDTAAAMVEEKLNQTQVNCMVAASAVEAVLRNERAEDILAKIVHLNRGKMIRLGNVNIDNLDGVPCTDRGMWKDLAAGHRNVDNMQFVLQAHKLSDIPFVSGPAYAVRRVAPWSIHASTYRIICEPQPGKYLEISRGDCQVTLLELFDSHVDVRVSREASELPLTTMLVRAYKIKSTCDISLSEALQMLAQISNGVEIQQAALNTMGKTKGELFWRNIQQIVA